MYYMYFLNNKVRERYMARDKDIELVSKVWREEREPFGNLTDDFDEKFSKFVD